MPNEYNMRKFGVKGLALAKRQMSTRKYKVENTKMDDASERIKYMEEQLSKKRGYISYDKHKDILRKQALAKKNAKDNVDWLTPFLILCGVALAIGIVMYYSGFLSV